MLHVDAIEAIPCVKRADVALEIDDPLLGLYRVSDLADGGVVVIGRALLPGGESETCNALRPRFQDARDLGQVVLDVVRQHVREHGDEEGEIE